MRGTRKPGTAGKGVCVRVVIGLATVALLGLITYYNVSFVYYRSQAAAQLQLATEARATPNRRYQGASDGLLHAGTVVANAAAGAAGSAALPDAAREAAPTLSATTLNGVALSPAAVARRSAALAAQKAAADAAAAAGCKPLRPFHTLLTAQSTTYQNWQARIMYFHFKKQQAAAGACGEMGGFTRIVAHGTGEPDGLESEIPSIFVTEYTPAELARFKHFAVMNRPFSVKQMLASAELMAGFVEDYVMIAETDHVLLQPLPNLASYEQPAAYHFGYMTASPANQAVISRISAAVRWQQVQPIGPSPAIMHFDVLRRLTGKWDDYSIKLKLDDEADKMFGWVLEMWGYSIAAAELGIVHRVLTGFQCEPGAQSRMGEGYTREYFIHHYTYGSEYRLDGSPQGVNQIGEWSLDKRHYGGAYPPRNLQLPPDVGHSARNYAPRWLAMAWNEASAAIATWPATKAMGTVGWRREPPTAAQLAASALGSQLVGSKWQWSGVSGLVFGPLGALTTPWGTGTWGLLPAPDGGGGEAIFCDFASALHNLRFDLAQGTFVSERVGDGEKVMGTRDAVA